MFGWGKTTTKAQDTRLAQQSYTKSRQAAVTSLGAACTQALLKEIERVAGNTRADQLNFNLTNAASDIIKTTFAAIFEQDGLDNDELMIIYTAVSKTATSEGFNVGELAGSTFSIDWEAPEVPEVPDFVEVEEDSSFEEDSSEEEA